MSGSTSPLLLQALTGMNQQQDPALAAQLPKMQLAQALMQQGTDSSPTSKWGGISRLASALAGAYTFNQANEGVQDILKNRQQQTTDSLARMNAAGSPAPQPAPAQPTSQASPVGSFAAKLGGSEAPNAGTVNPGGYSGQYQFGAARLASPGVGVYTPAPGEDLNANQWRGSFDIPGFPSVKTHADFLASPGAQNAVFATHLGDIDKTIANTPGAANMSQDGLRAVAHLGGSDGMQKFVAGGYDPADANGTHLSDYYNKFSQPAGGSTQVAGPGAPTGAGPSPAPSQYPPNFQRGLDMMHAAQQEMAASPYNQEIQQSGQRKIQEAAEIMKLETYQQTAPGTYQSSTGKPVFAPSPRVYTDAHGNTGAVGPGGQTTPIATNPSGVTGSTPDANSMRIIAELGPKVLAGTATPQEVANYHVAATTYQHFRTITDPASKGLTSIPETPLPPGAPPSGPTAMPGSPPQLTGSPRGPDAAQAITETQAKADADEISKDQALTLKDHAIMGTSQTIRSMLPQVTQGVGAEQRLKAAQIFQSLGVAPQTAQSWLGTSAAPGEILQKKLFELSTGAERAAMGARGSASVVGMFTKNYPGMTSQNMTTDAMTRLLDMDQVYKENEIANRQQYLSQQVQGVAQGKPYGGLAEYKQPDPRVYQAAALASGGMPHSIWTSGLTPQQQTNALQLAAKVYPDATALDANGVKHQFRAQQAAAGGGGG